MKKNFPKKDFEEFDIIKLLMILFYNIKIIFFSSFIAIVLSLTYYYLQPKVYKFPVKINLADKSSFIKYSEMNNLLKDKFNFKDFNIDQDSIYEIFTNKFKDTEYLNNLENQLTKINIINFQQNKSITFSKIEQNIFNIYSNDKSEIEEIVKYVFDSVLNEIKNSIVNNIEKILRAIEKKNNNKIEQLDDELKNLSLLNEIKNEQRIIFLKEQLEIAKKLNISRIENENLNLYLIENNKNYTPLDFNSYDYYRRGYEAIQYEIDSIIKLTKEEKKIYASDIYYEKLSELEKLKSNIFIEQLHREFLILKNDNPQNWMGYDINTKSIKAINKSIIFILFFGLLAGILFGIFCIIILDTLKRVKNIKI